MSDSFDRSRDEVMKDAILTAIERSNDRDAIRVALFTNEPELAPPVDHGYARFDWHADTFAVVAGSGSVVWAWAWMKPARPWKLPYNRLSKARRRR